MAVLNDDKMCGHPCSRKERCLQTYSFKRSNAVALRWMVSQNELDLVGNPIRDLLELFTAGRDCSQLPTEDGSHEGSTFGGSRFILPTIRPLPRPQEREGGVGLYSDRFIVRCLSHVLAVSNLTAANCRSVH